MTKTETTDAAAAADSAVFRSARVEIDLRNSAALTDLVNDLDRPSIWAGLNLEPSRKLDDAALNTLQAFIKRQDRNANTAIEQTRRQVDTRFLVRAVVFKAEALARQGYLAGALDAAGIKLAANADTPQRAENSAIARYLAGTLNNERADKYRILRLAGAMEGVESRCAEKRIAITFANADLILQEVSGLTKSKLCEISKTAKAGTVGPPLPEKAAAAENADDFTSDPVDAEAQEAEEGLASMEAKDVSPDAMVSPTAAPVENHDELPILATVAIPRHKLPAGDTFILVAERYETEFRLRGPLFAGSDATRLAKTFVTAQADGSNPLEDNKDQ